jgi:hypothetical protein
MTDEYEIPAGETGIEPGTYLCVLTALTPFTLYEKRDGWSREKPENPADIVETYNKIEWTFATDDGEIGKGQTSIARSERSTLFAWATGLGMAPAVVLDRSKPIPAGQLIGREGLVTFALDKGGYSRATSVVPAPRQKQQPNLSPADPASANFGVAGVQPAAAVAVDATGNAQPGDLPF